MTDDKIPNPGSPEAVEMGCKCPFLDNSHGAGIMWAGERNWWINHDCPLHWTNKKAPSFEGVGGGEE